MEINFLSQILSKFTLWKQNKNTKNYTFEYINIFDITKNDNESEYKNIEYYIASLSIEKEAFFDINCLYNAVCQNQPLFFHLILLFEDNTKKKNVFLFIISTNDNIINHICNEVYIAFIDNYKSNLTVITEGNKSIDEHQITLLKNYYHNKLIIAILKVLYQYSSTNAYIYESLHNAIRTPKSFPFYSIENAISFSIEQENNIQENKSKISDLIEDDDDEHIDDFLSSIPASRGVKRDYFQIEESKMVEYSEVVENFLYLGSYKTAGDLKILQQLQITHIINVSGGYCANISTSSIKYLTFNLVDSVRENIECIFYECFEFIRECQLNDNGKILIHCYKGLSRSASVVMAYLIYSFKMDVESALNYLQTFNTAINPNLGFYLQLRQFYKRVTSPISINRLLIFAICSIKQEQPSLIVSKLLFSSLDVDKESESKSSIPILDERGMFIICDINNTFFLYGSKILQKNMELYRKEGDRYVNLLREYEHVAKGNPIETKQGEENQQMMKILSEYDLKIAYGNNKNYALCYCDLMSSLIEGNKNGLSQSDFRGISNINKKVIRKAFYFYPNSFGYKVLTIDDLTNDELMIACTKYEGDNRVYIWKGSLCCKTNEEIEIFKKCVISDFYKEKDSNNINEIIECPFDESDDFLNLL